MSHSVLQQWDHLVRTGPEEPAVIEAESARCWSRDELDRAAREWCVSTPGMMTRQRVAFALPNGASWFTLFLGLLRADAVPVPLDPSEPRSAQLGMARAIRAPWAWIDGRLEPSGEPGRRRRTNEWLVKLTSGSTGRPKILPFTADQMWADGRQVCRSMGIRPGDRNLALIPLGHSYGLGNLVLPLYLQGTPVVCASSPLPHALAADIARWRPSVFPAVPALLRSLAASTLPANGLGSLRLVISAGAPLDPETAQAFHGKFGLCPHSFYGSSETGGITYDRGGRATLEGRSVGKPLTGVRLQPVRGQRIRVESAAVGGRGRFSPSDRAQLNKQGELVLLGRTGRLVKIAGRRLDLGDLEASLRSLSGIRDAWVSLDPRHPDKLAAVIATQLDIPGLRRILREKLAPWKIPAHLIPVAGLPVTTRGKTDRRALEEMLNSRG